MKRYIGYVESIDWENNQCKVRVPNVDGLDKLSYVDLGIAVLRQVRTKNADLENASIPYHLQGLRVKDIVFLVDSEDENDDYTIVGFYGGVSEE